MDHGRILEIIEQAAVEGWMRLDLSGNQLTLPVPYRRSRHFPV